MNVEQTKRMNLMIKELTKSGMVSSFDDAVDTAAGLYEGAMPQDQNVSQVIEATKDVGCSAQEHQDTGQSLEHQEHTSEESSAKQPQESHHSPSSTPSLDLETVRETVQSCVRESIDSNNQSIAKDLRSLYEEIQKVQQGYRKEIEELRNQVRALQASRPSGQQELSGEPEKKAEKKEESPRQGSYSPDTVVLENYFYYGNK